MNTKRFSKILAALLAFVLCFAMAMPAFAAGNYTGMTDANQTYNFDKYLLMDNGVAVPAVDFTFTIAPGEAITADDGTVEIFAGIPTPTIEDGVSFTSGSTVYTSVQEGNTVTGFAAGKQYAKETAQVDFSSVVFPEPGVYRYIITESASNYPGITNDTVTTRVLDVYVHDATGSDGVKKLAIAGYVLHTNEDAEITAGEGNGTDDYDDTTKSSGFTNVYDTHDLSFSKTVDGNQASRDKYFAFTVTIEGALKNTTYTVDLTNAEATSGTNSATVAANAGKTNTATITTDGDGKAEVTFYLQHGQSITIKDLPEGATWTIEENEEDYIASVEVTGDTTADGDGNEASDEDGITADTTAAFKNYRNGAVPTGVLLTVAPFAVIMLVGIAGVVFVVLKKKRASAE